MVLRLRLSSSKQPERNRWRLRPRSGTFSWPQVTGSLAIPGHLVMRGLNDRRNESRRHQSPADIAWRTDRVVTQAWASIPLRFATQFMGRRVAVRGVYRVCQRHHRGVPYSGIAKAAARTVEDKTIIVEPLNIHARVVELPPRAKISKRVVIPSNPTRKVLRVYERDLYRARHPIESLFARLKKYRAIARVMARPRTASRARSTGLLQSSCSIDEGPNALV